MKQFKNKRNKSKLQPLPFDFRLEWGVAVIVEVMRFIMLGNSLKRKTGKSRNIKL